MKDTKHEVGDELQIYEQFRTWERIEERHALQVKSKIGYQRSAKFLLGLLGCDNSTLTVDLGTNAGIQ